MTRTAEQLQTDVEQELRWEPSVHSEQIGVSVRNGVIELDGHVSSFYEKWGAERAALRVANASAIASEIIVDIPVGDVRSDEDIAVAATNQMEWNSLIPDTVKLKVSDGWVTINGTAEWQYQREEAQRIFGSLLGVKGVSNEIQLKPKLTPTEIRVKLEDALRRNAQLNWQSISVEAMGSAVTLTGHVHSWMQYQEAEQVAFRSPGVSSVTNLLAIRY
jgi:osmotically-inducible protein OsmY